MSFSKSKIQRFNETKNDVPPPGTYNPKFDDKVKGSVIEKSERFHDNKNIVGGECDLTSLSKSTSSLHMNCKMSQQPADQLITRSCSKAKQQLLHSLNDKKLKNKFESHLAGPKLACSKADTIIQKHEKHIDNMHEEVQKLELKLEELRKKQVEVEEQHKKDIETMTTLQQEVLNNHIQKHQAEIEQLQCQLLEISQKKEAEIKTISAVEGNLKDRIAMLESDIENKNCLSQEKIQTLEKQIEELEQEKSELNSCITRLTKEIAECEERLKGVITESDVKIYAMIREAKTAVEEEMRLTAERYKLYLRRVEMDRVALDEKLVQKDTEITRLFDILEEFKSSAETQESFGESLQMELDRAETELARKKEELKALKEQICSEAAEIVSTKKRFEIVMAENQASVAALTQHLTQNDTEAERLQLKLKRGEDCINEHRDLLDIMRNNSQMVHVQMHALMEQLNAKKGLVNQLESDSLSKFESIKSIFEAKIENLSQAVVNKVTLQVQAQLQSDLDEKDVQIAKLQNQLQEVSKQLHDARVMLLELEEKNDAQELEISRVQLLNDKLNDELKASKATVEETNKLLEFQSTQHEITLHEANAKIQELSDIIKDFEEQDHIIQDKLLDEERACRIAAEEEIKKLLEYNERLAKDYKEINEKYAELIGHQNHRQRIKHVSQLKDKINQLEQDLRVKIRTIGKQQKVIEELKAEKRNTCSKEKENMLGISKYAHSTPETSPHKLLTPLKDRNDYL